MGSGLILLAVPTVLSAEEDAPNSDAPGQTLGKIVTLTRFEVVASVLGSIGVHFAMNKVDADDPTATIYWATVTEVTPGSAASKTGFKPGDELIRLNGQLIRGLTIAEFFSLIQKTRLHGDLVWKTRRGVLGLDSTLVFNGRPGSKTGH